MQYIKIYGLPRTCTNLAESIIKTNFTDVFVLTNLPDWKHGRKTFEGKSYHNEEKDIHTDDLKFVICLKDPYEWLWSLYIFENSTKSKRTIEGFLNHPAWHYKDLQWTAMDAFNNLISHWLSLPEDKVTTKQEDLRSAEGQFAFCENLKHHFKLIPLSDKWTPVLKEINPNLKTSDHEYVPNVVQFKPSHIKLIKNKLDIEVVRMAGYGL